MSEAKEKSEKASTTVTAEALLKSIQDLEAAKRDEEKTQGQEKMETVALTKSAKENLESKASEDLKKSLDVSKTLKEFTELMGEHVDTSLSTLSKSIQDSADRDLAMVKVLTDLKKSIDANTAAVEKFGAEPTGKPKSAVTTENETLEKSAKENEKKPDPSALRKGVLANLETLAKSCDAGSRESMEYTQAAIRFEATGDISPVMLEKVRNLSHKA